jgi:hypothetical protein
VDQGRVAAVDQVLGEWIPATAALSALVAGMVATSVMT